MPVEVIDTIKPANGNTFPVADVVDLKGVDQNFADIAERDAFDAEKLVVGQRARTRADSKTWQVASLAPVVWTEVAASGGAVSSVAGRTGDVVLSTADISGLGNSATRDVGTAAGTVAAGDDSRMTNARTPTSHAASHASGGGDPVTPAAIGAEVAGTTATHAALTTAHGESAFGATLKTSSGAPAARSTLGLPASATRTITHSSSPPSGGVAGDIHFQIP